MREWQNPAFLAIFYKCRIRDDLENENLEKPISSRDCAFSKALCLARNRPQRAEHPKFIYKFLQKDKILQRCKHFTHPFLFFPPKLLFFVIHNFPRHEDPAACVVLLALRLLCVT